MPTADWWAGFATGCGLLAFCFAFAEMVADRAGDYREPTEGTPDPDLERGAAGPSADVIDMHEYAESRGPRHHQRGA